MGDIITVSMVIEGAFLHRALHIKYESSLYSTTMPRLAVWSFTACNMYDTDGFEFQQRLL
jgi:hypothetical protein